MVETAILQASLDDAWDAAPEEANVLRAQLRIFETGSRQLLATGSISSVSKNSAQQSYAQPNPYNLTALQVLECWRTLINLYDVCVSDLAVTGDVDNDPEIYAEMQIRLRSQPTEHYPDVSMARMGVCI